MVATHQKTRSRISFEQVDDAQSNIFDYVGGTNDCCARIVDYVCSSKTVAVDVATYMGGSRIS